MYKNKLILMDESNDDIYVDGAVQCGAVYCSILLMKNSATQAIVRHCSEDYFCITNTISATFCIF